MLISKQDYFKRISELNDSDLIRNYLDSNNIDIDVILKLHRIKPILTVEFYLFLLNKLHKITTNLMRLDPLPLSECVKTATSIITQATITLEKHSKNDLDISDEFIKCVGLSSLSKSLYIFFSTGNSDLLESELSRIREDILFVKNNVPKIISIITDDDKIKNEVKI